MSADSEGRRQLHGSAIGAIVRGRNAEKGPTFWELILYDYCFEILNNFIFKFVFCKKRLIGKRSTLPLKGLEPRLKRDLDTPCLLDVSSLPTWTASPHSLPPLRHSSFPDPMGEGLELRVPHIAALSETQVHSTGDHHLDLCT